MNFDHSAHAAAARAQYEDPAYQTYLHAVCAELRTRLDGLVAAMVLADQFIVSARVKTPASFEAKAMRCRDTDRSEPRYRKPLSLITDQVGARVCVLHAGQLSAVADHLQAVLDADERDDKTNQNTADRRFGYGGIHLRVPVGVCTPCAGAMPNAVERVEIQVRTFAQHSWAVAEHRMRYKAGETPDRISRELDRAAALLETADEMIARLVDATERAEAADRPHTMQDLLDQRFPGERQPVPSSLDWITRCAQTLGFEAPERLDARLDSVPLEDIERVFTAAGQYRRSQVRRLDDALLWIGGDAYVRAAESGVPGTSDRYAAPRPGILRWRLARMVEAGRV